MKKLFRIVWCTLLLSVCLDHTYGQIGEGLQEWAEEIATLYAEETEMEDASVLIERLLDIVRNPININAADREALEQIFFLTDIQVENILFKRYVNGPFLTIYELQAVEDLPSETIQQLEPLLVFGEGERELGKFRVWGDSFLRGGYQLEKADGFNKDEFGETAYLGDRFKLYNRTQIESNRNFSAGMILEKDPGEPMFDKRIDAIDLMSGYLHYKKDEGLLREALAGRFFAGAGQGLVLQSGMPLRKSSMATSIRNRRGSFRPSLSASEAMTMQGGYAVIGFHSFEVIPFYSVNYRDGRLDEAGTLTSLREDGMHRTLNEIEQRHNVKEQVAGGKISWNGRWLQLEGGHVCYALDKPLQPEMKPYNQFYFKGKENHNSWLGYMLSLKKLLLFGEFAANEMNQFAVFNGMVWGVDPGFSLSLSHRVFSKKYHAPLAGPMTESSSFQGEEGLYCGIRWELPAQILFTSYFDYYRFGWLKFRTDAPSSGFDYMGNVEKNFGENSRLGLKARYREKPLNSSTDVTEQPVIMQKYSQFKVQFRQKINPGWQLTSHLQWHFVKNDAGSESGNMVAQDLRWSNRKENLTLTGRLALFSVSDYDARLYAYEPHVLYVFSVPAYSGEGTRYLLLINYKLLPRLHFWFRAARWQYDDRGEVGSGNQRISSDHKTELTFQVRIKF